MPGGGIVPGGGVRPESGPMPGGGGGSGVRPECGLTPGDGTGPKRGIRPEDDPKSTPIGAALGAVDDPADGSSCGDDDTTGVTCGALRLCATPAP